MLYEVITQLKQFAKDNQSYFNVYASAQYTHRNSYYGAGKDPNAYGHTTDLSLVGGVQWSSNLHLGLPSYFTSGAEYQVVITSYSIHYTKLYEAQPCRPASRKPARDKRLHTLHHQNICLYLQRFPTWHYLQINELITRSTMLLQPRVQGKTIRKNRFSFV